MPRGVSKGRRGANLKPLLAKAKRAATPLLAKAHEYAVHHHAGILRSVLGELKKLGVHVEKAFFTELDELPHQISAALAKR